MLNVRQNRAGLYKYCGARRCGGDTKCYKMESVLVVGNNKWRRMCKIKVWSVCICLLVDVVDLSEYFALSFRVHKASSLLFFSDNYETKFICTNSYNINKQTKKTIFMAIKFQWLCSRFSTSVLICNKHNTTLDLLCVNTWFFPSNKQ